MSLEDSSEHERLERALREQGTRLRELQREVDRRGALVRDMAERLEQRTPAETVVLDGESSRALDRLRRQKEQAVARAVETEAARVELLLRLDELSGDVAWLRSMGARQSADSTDAVGPAEMRALEPRIAELERARDGAAAQARAAEQGLHAATRRTSQLEQELAALRLELVASKDALAEALAPGGTTGPAPAVDARFEPDQSCLEEPDARARIAELSVELVRSQQRCSQLKALFERVKNASGEAGVDEVVAACARLQGEREGLRARLSAAERSWRTRCDAWAARFSGLGARAACADLAAQKLRDSSETLSTVNGMLQEKNEILQKRNANQLSRIAALDQRASDQQRQSEQLQASYEQQRHQAAQYRARCEQQQREFDEACARHEQGRREADELRARHERQQREVQELFACREQQQREAQELRVRNEEITGECGRLQRASQEAEQGRLAAVGHARSLEQTLLEAKAELLALVDATLDDDAGPPSALSSETAGTRAKTHDPQAHGDVARPSSADV